MSKRCIYCGDADISLMSDAEVHKYLEKHRCKLQAESGNNYCFLHKTKRQAPEIKITNLLRIAGRDILRKIMG